MLCCFKGDKRHAEPPTERGNEAPSAGGEPDSFANRIKSSFMFKRPPSLLKTHSPCLQVLSLTSTVAAGSSEQHLPSAFPVKGWGVVHDEARECVPRSKPSSNMDSPQLVLHVWCVEQLAHLHPRTLERILPHLIALPCPTSPGASCDARSAVASYWQLQEAQETLTSAGMEAARRPDGSLHPLPEAGEVSEDGLFLQPMAINTSAELLLGCAPKTSDCARILAQQLQFQCQAPSQQPISTTIHGSSSLAAVLFDVAAQTLHCTPSMPAAEPSSHGFGLIAPGYKPHTAVGHLPKQAQCGDGLVANVQAAYCTLSGGLLQPVLVLEHEILEAASTSSVREQHGFAGAPGPNGGSFSLEAGPQKKSDSQLILSNEGKPADSVGAPEISSAGMSANRAKLPLPSRPSIPTAQPSWPIHQSPAAAQQQLLRGPMGSLPIRESMRIMLQGGAPLLTIAGSKNDGGSASGPISNPYLGTMGSGGPNLESSSSLRPSQGPFQQSPLRSVQPSSAEALPLPVGSARVTPSSTSSTWITPAAPTLLGSSTRECREPRMAHAGNDPRLVPHSASTPALSDLHASIESAFHVHQHDGEEHRLGQEDRSEPILRQNNIGAPASPGKGLHSTLQQRSLSTLPGPASQDQDPSRSQGASLHSSRKSTDSQFDISTAMSWASKGLASNLLRALAVLNEVPVIATLVELSGRVLYQNAPSKNYWGPLASQSHQSGHTSACSNNSNAAGNLNWLLGTLLPNDTGSIQGLLDEVRAGGIWQRVLAVPPPVGVLQSVHSASQNLSNSASFTFEDSMARNSRATSHAPESWAGIPLRWPLCHLRSNSLGTGTLGGVQEAEMENVGGRSRRRSFSMDTAQYERGRSELLRAEVDTHAQHWVKDMQQRRHAVQMHKDETQEQQQQGEQPLQREPLAGCQQQKHRRPPSKKRNVSFAGIREFKKEHVERVHPHEILELRRQRRNSDGSCPFSKQLECLICPKEGGHFPEVTSDKLGCSIPEPQSNAVETVQRRRLPSRSRTDGLLELGRVFRRRSCPDVATMFAMNKSKAAMKSALKQPQQLSPSNKSAPMSTVHNQGQIELGLSQLPPKQLSGADILLPSPPVTAVVAAAANAADAPALRGENNFLGKSLGIPAASLEDLGQQRRRPPVNVCRSSAFPVAEQGVDNQGTIYEENLPERDFAGGPPEGRPWILSRERGSGGKGSGCEQADKSSGRILTSQGMKTFATDTPWQQKRRHNPLRRCVTSRPVLMAPLSVESGDARRPPHLVAQDDACQATVPGASHRLRSSSVAMYDVLSPNFWPSSSGARNTRRSSVVVLSPSGSQTFATATSKIDPSITAQARSGMAVEPSGRVLSLIQSTADSGSLDELRQGSVSSSRAQIPGREMQQDVPDLSRKSQLKASRARTQSISQLNAKLNGVARQKSCGSDENELEAAAQRDLAKTRQQAGSTPQHSLHCQTSSDEVASSAILASNSTSGQSPFGSPEHQGHAWLHSRPSQLSHTVRGSSQTSSKRSQAVPSSQQSPCPSTGAVTSPQPAGPHPTLLEAGWVGSRTRSAGDIVEHPEARHEEDGVGAHVERESGKSHGLPKEGSCSGGEMQQQDFAPCTRHKGSLPGRGVLPLEQSGEHIDRGSKPGTTTNSHSCRPGFGSEGLLLFGSGTDRKSPCGRHGPSKANSSAMNPSLDRLDLPEVQENISHQQSVSSRQCPELACTDALPADLAPALGGKSKEALGRSSDSKRSATGYPGSVLPCKFAREGNGSWDSTPFETAEGPVSSCQALPLLCKAGNSSRTHVVRTTDRASMHSPSNANSGVLDVSVDAWGMGSTAPSSRVEGQWELDLGWPRSHHQPQCSFGEEEENERDQVFSMSSGLQFGDTRSLQQEQQQEQQQQQQQQQRQRPLSPKLQQEERQQQQEPLQRPPSPFAFESDAASHGLDDKLGWGWQRSKEMCSGYLSGNDTRADEGKDVHPESVPVGMCWHDVQAMAITDPVTGQTALLLLQTDITSRALLESRMATLTESQLSMLEQMFPRHVLEYMVIKQPGQQPPQAETVSQLASSHENVTILFTDIVGFTGMSKEVKPNQVMAYLNELFTAFDALVDTYEIYKVETAGDCYIAAGGLTKIDQDGFICIDHEPDPVEAAHRVLSFAKALLYCAKTVMMPHNGEPTRIRVGMHTGPAVTGLIGTKLPKYSVFGDTMNTASRMESSCPYGCIQISDSTHALLTDHPFKPTGGVEVKGKGRMDTFIWDPEEEPKYMMPPDVAAAIACAKSRASEAGSGSGFKELLPQLFVSPGSTKMMDENSPRRSCSTTSGATPRMSNCSSGQFLSWGEELNRKSSMSAPQLPRNQHRSKRLSQTKRLREGVIQDCPARALQRMTQSMPARPQPERPSELETRATLHGTLAPSTPDELQDCPARALQRMTQSMPERPQPERSSELETRATLHGTLAPSTPDQLQDCPARALQRMSQSMPARPQPERPSELETRATLHGTLAPSTPDQLQAAPWPPNPQHHREDGRHQQPQHQQQQRLQQQQLQHQQQSDQQHHHQQQQLQPPLMAPCDERPPESAVSPISIPRSPHSHHSQSLASPPDSSALDKVGSPSHTDINPLYTSLGSEETTHCGRSRFSAGPCTASRAGSHSTGGPLKAWEQESSRPSLSSRSSKPGGRSTPLGRSSLHATATTSVCVSPSLECLCHSAAFNPAVSAAAAAGSSRSSPPYCIHPKQSRRRNSESHLNPSHRRSSSRGKISPLLLLRSPLSAFRQGGRQPSRQQESPEGAASLEALQPARSSTFSSKSAPMMFLQPSSAAPNQRNSGGTSSVAASSASIAPSRRRASLGTFSHSGHRASPSGPGVQAVRRHPLLGLLLLHTSPAQAELLLHEHTVAQQGRPTPTTIHPSDNPHFSP